ncbi:MAG TPA: DinB family protein [Vicinamibacterales bacterium]|nr:DinB family protein [Vicinamibacterales bacterium]
MPPWATRLLSEIDAADARATALARSLTPDQLNWKPSPGEWSIGQCLDHLCVANEVYVAAVASGLGDRHRTPVDEITPGWFGRWFIRTAIEPSAQSRKGKAPRKIVPASNVDGTILDRFLRTNVKARAFIRRAAQYDVNRVRFRNPFVPIIFFTAGTGLEILVRHQRRHLLQAERVRERFA